MSDATEHTPRVWSCKVGTRESVDLRPGSDLPMRRAVEAAFLKVTGIEPEFNFSGWAAELDESELAVVENRAPSEEHYRRWLAEQAAPDLLKALQALLHAVCHETGFAAAVRQDSGKAYPWEGMDAAEAEAIAAISKATGAEQSPTSHGRAVQ